MVSPIFASNVLKVLSFKLFLLADVYNYCEELRIKLLINIHVLNIENLRSNFLEFFYFFYNYLATLWHSCQDSCLVKHFASTIWAGLAKKIFNRAYLTCSA